MEELIEDFEIQERDRKKIFLKRYKKNVALIDRLYNKVEILDRRSETVKSPNYSGMPRGGTPITAFDLKDEKNDLLARIDRLKKKGEIYKSEILEVIDNLDDTRYAEVLESYFIDCKDLSEIAEEMGYSIRHVKSLYSKGIDSITLL